MIAEERREVATIARPTGRESGEGVATNHGLTKVADVATKGKSDPDNNKGVAAHQGLATLADVAEGGASNPNPFWKLLKQAGYELW